MIARHILLDDDHDGALPNHKSIVDDTVVSISHRRESAPNRNREDREIGRSAAITSHSRRAALVGLDLNLLGCTPASFLISFAGNTSILMIIISRIRQRIRVHEKFHGKTHLLDPYFPMLRYGVVQGDFADLVRRPDFLQGFNAGRRVGDDVSADLAGNGLFHSSGPAFLRRLQWIHIKIAVRFLGQIALRKRRNRPATEHSNSATRLRRKNGERLGAYM